MYASRIIKNSLLSTVLLLAGCSLLDDGATKRPANIGLISTPVSYYSTARARYLGAKYKDNLDRLVERIVRHPKTTSLQFANNISSVGGIGFFTHSVTKSADERFLEVVLAAPETFDSKGGHNDKVNRLFNAYGSELLAILSSDNDIYQDKEVTGYGINLAWRNVVAEPAGSRVILERAIIYVAKEKPRRFLRREISQSDLLADATIFAMEEDGPLNLISYRAPEARQESAPAIREDDIAPAPADGVPVQSPVMPTEQDKKDAPAVREPVAQAAPPIPPLTVAQKTKPLPLKPAPELQKPSPVELLPVEAVAPAIANSMPPAVAVPQPPVLAEVSVRPVPAVMIAPVAKVETRAMETASVSPTVVTPAPVQPPRPAAASVAATTKPPLIEAPTRRAVPTSSPPAVPEPAEIASLPAVVTKPLAIDLAPVPAAPQTAPARIVTREAPVEPAIARPIAPRALEGFIIQLAFNDKNRAQRWAEGMEKKGFAISVTEAGNEGALRVRLGNFAARDDAERQLRALKQEGLNGIILNLPQGFRPEARSSIP